MIIVVKTMSGNVSDPLVIRIPDIKKNNGQREMGAMEIPARLHRDPGMAEIKVKPTVPGKGNNGEGSLANLKTVGGKGTSSGKNGKNESEKRIKETDGLCRYEEKRLRFRKVR